ncbi:MULTISPECIES: hypothetical protein [Streptomyces]|uniref:hypothetical protein n=1 Tax=Streptomyces TaxID=1883 RepID=UPI00131D3FE2|nr:MULTISPECIES: hypothetical protein [Streptomyces]MDI5911844.1 hypothetical protein [Streptomyces sp. 12257]
MSRRRDVQILQVVQIERLVHRVADLDLLGLVPGQRKDGLAPGTESPEVLIRRVDPAAFATFVDWTSTSAE